jgi:hypothetical protein
MVSAAVPLQAIALAALDQLPGDPDCPLLFPSPRGGYLDLHNFRNRSWNRPRRPPASRRPAGSTICGTRQEVDMEIREFGWRSLAQRSRLCQRLLQT